MKEAIMLSIKPKYANKIFSGEKTVELRRVCPKGLSPGSLVLVYVSSPDQELRGAFKVSRVVREPLNALWKKVIRKAGVSRKDYDAYFKNKSHGIGIFIEELWCLREPVQLKQLKKTSKNFHPPQCFRYLRKENSLFEKFSKFMAVN